MQFIESVSFLGVNFLLNFQISVFNLFVYFQRDQIITQLEIEMKEFRRFQYPYKTDKWLNIVQWEEIESYLLKNAKKQKNLKSKDELLSGSSVFGDLSVTFKFVAKAESYIDFMKKNYHLDWILKVKVESLINAATTDTVVQSSESLEYNPIDNQIETSTSRYKPSSQTSFENKAAFEYSPQRVSNENEPKVSSYTPSRITRRSPKSEQDKSNESASQKMIELFGIDDDDKHDIASNCNGDNKQGDNSPTLKESRKRRKKRFPVYVESSSSEDNKEEEKREVQVRADKKVKSNQPMITSMLTKRSDETLETLSKITQRSKRSKSSKLSKNKSCPMKIVPKEVIPFDSEEFSYLNNFIEKTNREEAQKILRKEELKSLEMLNCNDLTNDELKKYEKL